jgi:hypothetical protein
MRLLWFIQYLTPTVTIFPGLSVSSISTYVLFFLILNLNFFAIPVTSFGVFLIEHVTISPNLNPNFAAIVFDIINFFSSNSFFNSSSFILSFSVNTLHLFNLSVFILPVISSLYSNRVSGIPIPV